MNFAILRLSPGFGLHQILQSFDLNPAQNHFRFNRLDRLERGDPPPVGGVSSRAGKYEEKSVAAGAAQEKFRAMVAPQAPLSPNLAKLTALQVLQNQRRTKNAELMVWICHQEFWIFGAKMILILFD